MLRSVYLLSFFLLQSLFAFAGNVKESVPHAWNRLPAVNKERNKNTSFFIICYLAIFRTNVSQNH